MKDKIMKDKIMKDKKEAPDTAEEKKEASKQVQGEITGRVLYKKHPSGVWIIGKEVATEGTTVMIPKVYPGTNEFLIFHNEKSSKEAAIAYQKLLQWSIKQLKEMKKAESSTLPAIEKPTEVNSG